MAASLRERVQRATVQIGVYDNAKKKLFTVASGAIVTSDGHILTAAHTFLGPRKKVRWRSIA